MKATAPSIINDIMNLEKAKEKHNNGRNCAPLTRMEIMTYWSYVSGNVIIATSEFQGIIQPQTSSGLRFDGCIRVNYSNAIARESPVHGKYISPMAPLIDQG